MSETDHPEWQAPRHSPQQWPWGCMNHALCAVTGNPRVLQGLDDASAVRFALRALHWGYLLYPLFADSVLCRHYTDAEWWRDAFGRWGLERDARLLLTIDSIRHPGKGVMHAVGVVVQPTAGDEAWADVAVYDPGEPAAQTLTFEEFVGSPYARACEVLVVLSGDLARHPVVDGPSAGHVDPAVLAAWEQSRQQHAEEHRV